MSKQTAVEWFIEELFKKIDYIQVDPRIINQAKAMEKEQMIDFAQMWQDSPIEKYDCKEDLYNETFNK